mmetsp:Transcript_55048/g.66277  ORF Transcript_55048/g.66277 Transcript_55048/m.66277 type:complete len:80 (+) Transcript_55048:225-464(+)
MLRHTSTISNSTLCVPPDDKVIDKRCSLGLVIRMRILRHEQRRGRRRFKPTCENITVNINPTTKVRIFHVFDGEVLGRP